MLKKSKVNMESPDTNENLIKSDFLINKNKPKSYISLKQILTECKSIKECSNKPSQNKPKSILLNKISIKTSLKRVSHKEALSKFVSSESQKSFSKVPNDTSNSLDGYYKSEKDLFRNSLNKTKTPKLLPDLKKTKLNHAKVNSSILRKKSNDSLYKFKFLFEDLDHNSNSKHISNLKSAFYRNKTLNDHSEDCDLSNLNKNFNNSSIVKTHNTSVINLSKNEDNDRRLSIYRFNFQKSKTFKEC